MVSEVVEEVEKELLVGSIKLAGHLVNLIDVPVSQGAFQELQMVLEALGSRR
jgi:hypothetical protein